MHAALVKSAGADRLRLSWPSPLFANGHPGHAGGMPTGACVELAIEFDLWGDRSRESLVEAVPESDEPGPASMILGKRQASSASPLAWCRVVTWHRFSRSMIC